MSAAAPRPSSPGTMIPERDERTDSAGEVAMKPGSKLDDENRSSTGGATLPTTLLKEAAISSTTVTVGKDASLENEEASPRTITKTTPTAGLIAVPYSPLAATEKLDDEHENATMVHPVNFEVTTNSANPVKFIQELLWNLQTVDPKACIMPQPNAKSGTPVLSTMEELPRGAARLKSIVNEFIAGLSTTATVMQGKVWIQSIYKLETFKWNGQFKKWLVGSATTPKIQLDRSTLNAVVRVPVGIFLNTVTRFDLADSFHDRLREMYAQSVGGKIELPEVQIEVKVLHRNGKGGTKFFRILAARDNVVKVRNAMQSLFPKPSDEITFIQFETWNTLTSAKKSNYFEMQKWFNGNHNAIKFRGLRTSSAMVMPNSKPGEAHVSIRTWMSDIKSSKNEPLFIQVFPIVSGIVELWYNNDVAVEAR
jgi:hypothetical protein